MASVSAGDAGDLYELFCENNKNDELRSGINRFSESIGKKINSYGEITQINEPVHFVRESIDYAIMRFEVDDIDIDGESIYSADIILCPIRIMTVSVWAFSFLRYTTVQTLYAKPAIS